MNKQPEDTMQSKHFDYLDGWRGLAITFLLIGHFFPVPGINLGAVGVNLFFVLSGLLMARVLFVQQTPISIFYKRRISRIFPAVFVFIATITLLYVMLGQAVSWSEVAAASLFVNNYFSGEPGNAVMPFGHIWSLCVEEHSYVLLSFVAIAARRKWISSTVAVGLFAVLFTVIGGYYWAYHNRETVTFERWIHSEVSAFGIFASAFLMLYLHKKKLPTLPVVAYPLLVLLGILMHWWSVPAPIAMVLGIGAFALAVNLLPSAPQRVQAALSPRPLRQLGLWSFSIYLWQQPFYLYAHRHGMAKGQALAMAIGAGIVSFYLIERPMRSYLNALWTGEKTAKSIGTSEKTA